MKLHEEMRQIERLKMDFIEIHGWCSMPVEPPVLLDGRGVDHYLHSICHLGGLIIFAVTSYDGLHPDGITRKVLMNKIRNLCYENIVIFLSQWGAHRWCREEKIIETPRPHEITEKLGVSLSEWEEKEPTIIDASRMADALFRIDRSANSIRE